MAKIKLIIFDLDGVLVDSREIHYKALNDALAKIDEKYIISREEHLSSYDGLSTTKKLDKLTLSKSLPKEFHHKIWALKQETTRDIIDSFTRDFRISEILKTLKDSSFLIGCCSNSIRHTAKLQLIRKGFLEYIDFLFTNEDVENPKPDSEMYLRCILAAKCNPDETLIIEDSHIGRKAALRSGARLCPVTCPNDLTLDRIKEFLIEQEIRPKWNGGKMNIIIPMAGAGSRFEKAGYTFPKPLIDVNGKPMIQVVVENLNIQAQYIFIVQKIHYTKYNLEHVLNLICPNCKIIQVEGVTEGAACTSLLAKDLINDSSPLLIANSDQFVDWDSNEFMYSMVGDTIDGGILTFKSTHPKWSYVRLNESGFVVEVAEKKPISNIATVGIYYFKKGSDYIAAAERMISKNIRTNNEFYVCPVFNEMILDEKKIKIFNIPKMWGLGTPEDLNTFLEHYK